MLSNSAIVKLKALLVIDLIIVGAVAGVYLYLQNEGVITTGAKPATFTLTDLTVNPLEAYVGEAIQISVNVTNIGELEGNQTVNLQINDVVKQTSNVTLAGNSTEIIEFTEIETAPGNYSVKIGDLTGVFNLKPAPPESSKIVLSSLLVNPYEAWVDEPITVTAIAENPSAETERLTARIAVDDVVVDSLVIELEAGAAKTVQFTVNGTIEGRHTLKVNTLSGSFTIVKTGFHTLTINRSGGGSTPLPFTLNGEDHKTVYQALLPVGEYSISVPTPFSVGTGVLEFSYWSDGVSSASRSFTLNSRLIMVATYTLISGYASCPSLYTWNGTAYSYTTDVSNAGWLGYIGHITPQGEIVFSGGNPWDYVKLDKSQLMQKDGYFDLALFQQWDELFYVDSASMLVVDHPIGTDVYTSMTNYLNKGATGRVYTVNGGGLLSPVSATNEKGSDVTAQILQKDGVFTPGINGNENTAWNNVTVNQLTLDLGDLSAAEQIKLIMTGMVDWGAAQPYYDWIASFKDAADQGLITSDTPITPDSFMEIKQADGSWLRIPQNAQIPIPSDYNARTFAVNLTGFFPQNIQNYQIRLTNFWNVTYDYIAIDTSPEQSITIQKISPTTASLSQIWDTQSTASGAFTRYGDVTPLVQEADDMYVIGRQGDQINLQFQTANLQELAPGMVRDYFFVDSAWFKDPPGNWGYGFNYTVDPLPFMAMSGFPYPATETYPYDALHQAYLQEYNTRIVTP